VRRIVCQPSGSNLDNARNTHPHRIGDLNKVVLQGFLERRLGFRNESLRSAFNKFGHLVEVEVAIIESLPKGLVHKDSAGLDA
jgi:hypothetical protein